MKKIKANEHGFGLIAVVMAITVLSLTFLGGYYVDRAKTPKNASSATNTSVQSSSSNSAAPSTLNTVNPSSSNLNTVTPSSTQSSGEQLSTKGMTRPSQYLQICTTSNSIEYITQGNPQCLGTDSYEGSYSTGVPGTLFSSPCETTSGTVRYVYISQDETCPDTTKLVFYNTLCPANASSSNDCTTPDSADTTN
jgi:hypothetical protein